MKKREKITLCFTRSLNYPCILHQTDETCTMKLWEPPILSMFLTPSQQPTSPPYLSGPNRQDGHGCLPNVSLSIQKGCWNNKQFKVAGDTLVLLLYPSARSSDGGGIGEPSAGDCDLGKHAVNETAFVCLCCSLSVFISFSLDIKKNKVILDSEKNIFMVCQANLDTINVCPCAESKMCRHANLLLNCRHTHTRICVTS